MKTEASSSILSCKGLCIHHQAQKPANRLSRYLVGRCQVCQIYLKWNGLWCPCCNTKLRINPRSRKYRTKILLQTAVNPVISRKG